MAVQRQQQGVGRRIKGVQAWLALWHAARAVEGQARHSAEANGLCLSDFAVLEALLHKGPMSVGELGRRVLLTSGSITTSIDRLERDGLVRRATTSTDRRARIVHLTDDGSTLIRTTFATHERDMERPFETLSAAEMRTLVRLLVKLRPDAVERAA
jgi:MarR family transcriptional regulator, 2-MHQ and catechol-resistance regulon repressor